MRVSSHTPFPISSVNKCIEGVPGFRFVLARRRPLPEAKGRARTLKSRSSRSVGRLCAITRIPASLRVLHEFCATAASLSIPDLSRQTDRRTVLSHRDHRPSVPARYSGSWSPDGKFLLYSLSGGNTPARIWVLPVSGGAAGKPHPLHDAQAYEADAQISPDGRWVAYVSQETGAPEVYVQPFPGPGGKERVSTQTGVSPRWARNGRQLYYRVVTGDPAIMGVDVQTTPQLRLGLPKSVVKGVFGTTLDVTPDGKRFLVELTQATEAGGRRMIGVDNWFQELKRRVPVKP